MPDSPEAAQDATPDRPARIVHLKWRGAFGLSFFFHHAVCLVRESGEPTDSADPQCPVLGRFDAARTTCVHWSAGGQNGNGPLLALDSAVIVEVPWASFLRGGIDGNPHFCGVEIVDYPRDTAAANPLEVVFERTRRFLGHQGVFVGVDRDGNTVDGYNPLSWNCEHFAVWCMTGTARSLQSERVLAAAGSVVSAVRSLASGQDGGGQSGNRSRSGGGGGALELAVGLLNLGVGAFGIFRSFQATADIRSDIAELRSVVASGSGASPDAALSRIETAIADQTSRLETAVASAAAASGSGAAEEAARRERIEFRQRCTELCSHYRRLATAASAAAAGGGGQPPQALVSPLLVAASAVRAAAAARLLEPPAGAGALTPGDTVDGRAPEWEARAAHCSAASFAARAEADAVTVLGLPPAAALEPLEAALGLVRSEAAAMMEAGGPTGARWAVLEQLLALHQGLRIEAETAARLADGSPAEAAAPAAGLSRGSHRHHRALLGSSGGGGEEALPERVRGVLMQPLANATAAVAAAAEAAQAAGPLPRRVAAERRALEAALPGLLAYVSSTLEAEFLSEPGTGAGPSGRGEPFGGELAIEEAGGGGRSAQDSEPEPFVDILAHEAGAGGESLGYLTGFLRENAPRYPHLVEGTPADRRGELLALTAPHDPEWGLLRVLLAGAGGSEGWDWPALLPPAAIAARGGLAHLLAHGQGPARAAALSAASLAAARGVFVLPLLSADPAVGPQAALEVLKAALGAGGAGAGEALLGPAAASALAETLPGEWGALAAAALRDQSQPHAARVERALRLAAAPPQDAAQPAAVGFVHSASFPSVGFVHSASFPSPPAAVDDRTGASDAVVHRSASTPSASAPESYPSVAPVRSGPDDPRWSGGRGQRVAVPPPAAWPGCAVSVGPGGALSAVPLALLASASGRALCVEVLAPDGSPFRPHRRWLRVAERRNALPFGLCFGHRLHCEALTDAEAAARLGEPDFRFRFSLAPGAACRGGVRGVMTSCVASIKTGQWFGIDHRLKEKYMAAGHCAEMPGTNVELIHHLALTPWEGPAGAEKCVTITLADYTDSPDDEPADPGYQLRWIDPARWENRNPDRTFPHFACTPFGYRKDCPGGEPGTSKFRFLLVED